MFGRWYGLYGSKILKSFHFVTFWFGKWSAPRNYSMFSEIIKRSCTFFSFSITFFLWNVQILGCNLIITRNIKMQGCHIIKLIIVNFVCLRRCLHLPIFIIFCKTKEIITNVYWTMARIELVTFELETKFLTTKPLRQCYVKWKWDDMFDSLSFLLGCQLFFYFSLIASCHSEVWRVALQVFESKIDQKSCCITLLLKKRTSTQ